MLSMKAKYALKALIVMANNEEALLQIKTISEKENIPHKFLETIMQELKNSGVVNSKRGIFGGYYLSQPPEKISIGNVIRTIDGPLAPIRCASVTAYEKCEDCRDETNCAIKKLMIKVRNSMADILDRCTLREISGGKESLDFFAYCI